MMGPALFAMTANRAARGLALALMLSACASRPDAVLLPATAPAGLGDQISLLTISTRAPSSRPGEVYSGRRAPGVSMAAIDVSVPPDHEVGRIEWPRDAENADPSRDFATLSISALDNDGVVAWFDRQHTDGRVLIFVHGFNVPFDGAVYRLAQIVADAGPRAAPVLFSWPSRGSTFAYVYDRESAAYSRDALEDVLRLAARSPHVQEITILSHSMGAWLTMEALRQYAIREGRVDSKISDVILASPDLDADVFVRQFEALGEERPRFTFLIARDDRALLLSRVLAGGVGRVGAADLTEEPYRSRLARMNDVTIVDMTGLHTGDRTNHLDFARSPEAVRLLSMTFARAENAGAVNGPSVGAQAGAVIVVLAQAVGRTVEDVERNGRHE
jgi:esterase/lipase superfamily enzyme